jgi:hypothetical protein
VKRTALRRKPKPRKQPAELERMEAFWAAAMHQGPCAVCGSRAALVAHHVVTQQHIRRADGDVWDPRNALPLCSGPAGCHDAHHSRQRPIPVSCVPTAALDFADELLGTDGAYAFFGRYYSPRSRWIGY